MRHLTVQRGRRRDVRPIVVGTGGYFKYRFTFLPNSSGSYTANTNLGITWADAGDHTVFLTSPPWDFEKGFQYKSILQEPYTDLKDFLTATTGSIVFYVVDAAGADLYSMGGIATTPEMGFAQLDISLVAASTPGNGIRVQVNSTGQTIVIPASIVFVGAPLS